MVRMRNLVKVGNREVKKRYIGNKLIFEDLGNKTEILSGTEIFTDKADDSVVHVEIDGKSVQEGEPSPDRPNEIHSLNDFDVVSSVGRRNYVPSSPYYSRGYGDASFENQKVDMTNEWGFSESYRIRASGGDSHIKTVWKSDNSSLSMEFGKEYTWSMYIKNMNDKSVMVHFNGLQGAPTKRIEPGFSGRISGTGTRRELYNWFQAILQVQNASHNVDVIVGRMKLEVGSELTPWTPALEEIEYRTDNHPFIDKINLLLDEPLRSAGDVKDRLFRDSDGLWKVERNVKVTGTEDGTQSIADAYSPYGVPVIEVLSEEYQNKLSNLRSFQNSNYVYTINDKTDISPTVAENLKPTLHTTFKSKGWYDYYKKTLLK